jgi:branched-chain amino acid transport system substrate-binding protein
MNFAKRGLLPLLFAAAVILAGITLFNIGPDKPIPIGFVAGLSGKFSDLGLDCRRGVEIAVARINKAGGIKERQLRLVTMDDGQDEKTAREAVSSLIAQQVPVIIGHSTSSMTLATLPLINASRTLLVSPTTSTPLLENIDDNFIRSCAVSKAAAVQMARYLRDQLGISSIGIIYDLSNKAYSEQWYNSFRQTFLEAGGQRVEPMTFTSRPDIEMLPLISQMREKDIDVLVIVANSVDAALLCQQVRKAGWQIPLALSDWAATEQLINLGGQAVEGAVISQFFNRKSTKPAYLSFKGEFLRSYKSEPGFGALLSYNAAMMIFRAMAEQQGDETLKETILRISHFEGLQDDIVINKYGDSNHPTYMGVIEKGSFKIFEEYR